MSEGEDRLGWLEAQGPGYIEDVRAKIGRIVMERTRPTCPRTDCEAEGRWLPVLLIWPNKEHHLNYKGPPSRAEMGLPFCEAHKESTTVDDLIGYEAFAAILQGFRAQNLAAPDPEMGLDWRELPGCKNDCDLPAKHKMLIKLGDPDKYVAISACVEHVAEVRGGLLENGYEIDAEMEYW